MIFCNFNGKYVQIIGLKAPGNYSASSWLNKILVLLSEGPKPNISMISGFLTPREPLFIDLKIPKDFKKYKKYGNVFKHIIFTNMRIQDVVVWKCCVPNLLEI